MNKVGVALFAMLSVGLLAGTMTAENTRSSGVGVPAGKGAAQNAGDNSVYFVTYYSNANTSGAPDGAVRLINDGDASTSETEGQANGPLWASFYIFDDSEEMQQCCNCEITADGLLSESINQQLRNPLNDLTGRAEQTRGVIKVISTASSDPTNNSPAPGLRGWGTHIQATTNVIGGATGATPTGDGPWFVTETNLADSNLNQYEQQAVQDSCSFIFTLGSGYGVCQCSLEDHDF